MLVVRGAHKITTTGFVAQSGPGIQRKPQNDVDARRGGGGQRCRNRGRVDPLIERPQGPTVGVYPAIRIGQSHHMALEIDNGIDGFGADQTIDRDLRASGTRARF